MFLTLFKYEKIPFHISLVISFIFCKMPFDLYCSSILQFFCLIFWFLQTYTFQRNQQFVAILRYTYMEWHRREQAVKFRARKFVTYMALYCTMVLNHWTYINTYRSLCLCLLSYKLLLQHTFLWYSSESDTFIFKTFQKLTTA